MQGVLLPWVQSFALFLLEPDEVSFGPVLRSAVVCLLVEVLPFTALAPSSSLPPPLYFTITCQFAEGAACVILLAAAECVWSPALAAGILLPACSWTFSHCGPVSHRSGWFSSSASLLFVELGLPQLPGETVLGDCLESCPKVNLTWVRWVNLGQ